MKQSSEWVEYTLQIRWNFLFNITIVLQVMTAEHLQNAESAQYYNWHLC